MKEKIKQLYVNTHNQIVLLKRKEKELDAEEKKIKTDLLEFLKSKDIARSESGNYDEIIITDDKNQYTYKIVDDSLRLKKDPHRGMRMRGFWHPAMMGEWLEEMIDHKLGREVEKKEIIWEGGKTPESEEIKNRTHDYYELLKNDLIENGEISKAIKTYLTEGVVKRKELLKIANEDLHTECNDLIRKFKSDMDNLVPEIIKNKSVIEKIDGIKILCGGSYWDKLSFIKVTKKQYQFEVSKTNKKDEITKAIKKYSIEDFNLSQIISAYGLRDINSRSELIGIEEKETVSGIIFCKK